MRAESAPSLPAHVQCTQGKNQKAVPRQNLPKNPKKSVPSLPLGLEEQWWHSAPLPKSRALFLNLDPSLVRAPQLAASGR